MLLSNRAMGDKYGPFQPMGPTGERPKWQELPPSAVPLERLRASPHPRYGGVPEVPSGLSRSVTPSAATDWLRDRMSHLRLANTRSPAAMTPRSTVSVASLPGNSQQDDMVKVIVETIEEQEAQIQRIRKECMKGMDKLAERIEKETSLRMFLEKCSNSTKTIWAKNQALQESNAKLRQQCNELLERASSVTSGRLASAPSVGSPLAHEGLGAVNA